MAFSCWLLLAGLLLLVGRVQAENATIASLDSIPNWQVNKVFHLQLTVPESEALQLNYGVWPMTPDAGLWPGNKTYTLHGSLVAAEDPANVERLNASDTIAFLCCDYDNSTQVVNQLMGDNPVAILLYSIKGNCCGLEGTNLTYTSLYTMGNSQEASDTMNNTLSAAGVLRATILSNNGTAGDTPPPPESSGSNSAVAMSILYSITGLITFLFLVIIATGAVRAHRYPERYGPRSAYGGQPPQSRARGLARAVLETLPVVKFGDPSPGKPDPAIELESQASGTAADPALGTRLSAIPEEPRTPQVHQGDAAPMSGAVPRSEEQAKAEPAGGGQADPPAEGIGESQPEGRPGDEHPGCSICTEDFTVGEDVRVLPCNHRFHPACVDPWLVNISGTCPLCRLDLRPVTDRIFGPRTTNPHTVGRYPAVLGVPPYGGSAVMASQYPAAAQTDQSQRQQQRRRSSVSARLGLDLHHLRHAASVEERIEILRRHRSVVVQRERERREREREEGGSGEGDGEGEGQQGTQRREDGGGGEGRGETTGRGGTEARRGDADGDRDSEVMWGALQQQEQEREWRRQFMPPGWRIADWWRQRRRLSALERELSRPPASPAPGGTSAPVPTSVSVFPRGRRISGPSPPSVSNRAADGEARTEAVQADETERSGQSGQQPAEESTQQLAEQPAQQPWRLLGALTV